MKSNTNTYEMRKDALKGVLGLFRASYPEGCIKLSNETIEHFTVKAQVGHFFKKNDYKVWSEPVLSSGRPDLLVLHKSGIAYIIEIVHSEKEASILKKKLKYPLDIITISTKDWNYDTFAI